VTLPFAPPLEPMLGTLADALPRGDGWWYEPKWDGFRVLVFKDGDEIDLRSRDSRPLLRYFPEVGEALKKALPDVAVADGEIVIATPTGLDFESLQLRLHPAASRVNKLSKELPASVVLWDLLAVGADDLREAPFSERRKRLQSAVRQTADVRLTPGTTDPETAEDWFRRFEGAGLDGVMAKRLEDPYQPGKRAMVKVKHENTLDCVVVGFRWHKKAADEVGSLVLAMFDDDGQLHPIGVASGFGAKQRKELTAELLPLREGAPEAPWAKWGDVEHRPDASQSRWSAGKDLSWEPIRLEKVAEVRTTQHSDRRLRHPAQFLRWRDDKKPADCKIEQMKVVPAAELESIFR
jgi:ATP-dependent DNA ligase